MVILFETTACKVEYSLQFKNGNRRYIETVSFSKLQNSSINRLACVAVVFLSERAHEACEVMLLFPGK